MEKEGETMISIARVRKMLDLFPLDGLRKAAEKIDSPDINLPLRDSLPAIQHGQLIDAFMAALTNDSFSHRKTLAIAPQLMWEECHAGGLPFIIGGPDALPLSEDMKAGVRVRLLAALESFPLDKILGICPGKVSSGTKRAEESGYLKRWRDRYGKAEQSYTHMRRIYRDATSSHDYKAREKTALEVEEFLFQCLRDMLGKEREHLLQFSDEPGRTLKSNVDRNPGWGVFVYLAIKYKA